MAPHLLGRVEEAENIALSRELYLVVTGVCWHLCGSYQDLHLCPLSPRQFCSQRSHLCASLG